MNSSSPLPSLPTDIKETRNPLQILESVKAIVQNSHFVLASGKHSDTYINKDALYPHPAITSLLAANIAQEARTLNSDVVVGPALGGIILSQWVAWHLSIITGQTVYSCYAEKRDNEFILTRGYDAIVQGKRVLVVEDILTTGTSARKTVQAVQRASGNVVGVAALCNRGSVIAHDLGTETLLFLSHIEATLYDQEECPLCKDNVPVNTTLGKG